MLKPGFSVFLSLVIVAPAAFGRLCVETSFVFGLVKRMNQPPSGGCVLKLRRPRAAQTIYVPAAFGRLCVETSSGVAFRGGATQPPSGGCVLKPYGRNLAQLEEAPAAFGRLCVETCEMGMGS